MPKLNLREALALAPFVAACIFITGLPFLAGFFTPLWLPGTAHVHGWVWPWLIPLVIAFVVISTLISEITDRLIILAFGRAYKSVITVLPHLLTFTILLGTYWLTMSDYRAAIASAVVGLGGYLLMTPMVGRLEDTAPDRRDFEYASGSDRRSQNHDA